eukprot:1088885-Amphidinium_carterae.1
MSGGLMPGMPCNMPGMGVVGPPGNGKGMPFGGMPGLALRVPARDTYMICFRGRRYAGPLSSSMLQDQMWRVFLAKPCGVLISSSRNKVKFVYALIGKQSLFLSIVATI